MNKVKFTVFLVDDSEEDRFFMKKMLERNSNLVLLGEARDGQEAMDYLSQAAKEHALPNLMILDLKMPRKNGYDVLTWIKDQDIQNLLVAVISGSCLEEDITRSLSLGAHVYFKKTSIRDEQDAILKNLTGLLEKAFPSLEYTSNAPKLAD